MLLRDLYMEDPVLSFFPDFSIMSYVQHLSGSGKPYYKYMADPKEVK